MRPLGQRKVHVPSEARLIRREWQQGTIDNIRTGTRVCQIAPSGMPIRQNFHASGPEWGENARHQYNMWFAMTRWEERVYPVDWVLDLLLNGWQPSGGVLILDHHDSTLIINKWTRALHPVLVILPYLCMMHPCAALPSWAFKGCDYANPKTVSWCPLQLNARIQSNYFWIPVVCVEY